MGSLEYQLAGSEEQLLKSLQFGLGDKPSSNYITSRRLTQFYPSGASTFTSNGVRVVRITVSGEGWLDPSTILLQFQLQNLDGAHPLGNFTFMAKYGTPAVFFDRVRVLSGAVLEDVWAANRVEAMLQRLMPAAWNREQRIDGYMLNDGGGAVNVAPNGGLTMQYKPLSLGLIAAGKMWPIFAAPLTFEWYLADSAECIGGLGLPAFSQNWALGNVELKADVLTLDSALQSSFARLLAEGKSLTIPITCFHTQYQMIPALSPTVSVAIVRSLTRLKGVLATFGAGDTHPLYFPNPNQTFGNGIVAGAVSDSPFNAIMSVGSKRYPEKPCDSLSWFAENLKKTLAIWNSELRTMSISAQEYASDSFIMGFSTERVPGAAFTGLNTRAGDLVRLEFNKLPNVATVFNWNNPAVHLAVDRIWVTLCADVILEIREGGVSVFD
jgi:hypothetical protein